MSEEYSKSSAEKMSWWKQVQVSYRTPLGLTGAGVTTVFFILSVLGLIAHIAGMVQNPYTIIVTVVLFPTGMLIGLLQVFVAILLGRRKILRKEPVPEGFGKEISVDQLRKTILLVLVLSVINVVFFATVSYEGYRFMDSPAFCGVVCHKVMAPEYSAHARFPHANVDCVDCHIGPSLTWFLKAKFSGLRQLKGVVTGGYHRPIPTPVENLPPAAVTCEKCHSPERNIGIQEKTFVSFAGDAQQKPEVQKIVLKTGGRDPVTNTLKGIHWHASHDTRIEYQPLDEKRTKIGTVRLSRADGTKKEFTKKSKANIPPLPWRQMDCTDCHNRPAHAFDDLVEKVDFGLNSKKIHPEIPGIREDSLTVLQNKYPSRDVADKKIAEDLKNLQQNRNGADFVAKNEKGIAATGEFLKEVYRSNIWPAMNITWGTYASHIGHRYAKAGYGCFRCHDDEHATDSGDTISQDCGLCHKEPE